MNVPAIGYSTVYHMEIGLLFLTLVVLGPLVRRQPRARTATSASERERFGLAEFPT